MKLNVLIHKAEEGGYWAEVPSLPGCFSHDETRDEMIHNIQESIEGYLQSVVINEDELEENTEIVELAL